MTFIGRVGPTTLTGTAQHRREPDREWLTACPLWITGKTTPHRRVDAREFVLDLFGFSSATYCELATVGHRFAMNGDLLALDAIATGSGVIVVRQPQRVTVVTDLAGAWPVFYATLGGWLFYSSTARMIAAQGASAVDEQWLATRLLASSVPETWSAASPYQDVKAVPAGGVLLIDSAARPVVVGRDLPLGSVDFAEGAHRLAGALAEAVRGRIQAYGAVSTDLSGGLDSSTVAALAAAALPSSSLPAITLLAGEPGGDDPAHARQVSTAIPGLQHLELLLPPDVDPYTALTELPHTDEPFLNVSIFARLRWWMQAVVEQCGTQVHLSGDGGDAVLVAPAAYLADLARYHARRELRRQAADWARLRHRPPHDHADGRGVLRAADSVPTPCRGMDRSGDRDRDAAFRPFPPYRARGTTTELLGHPGGHRAGGDHQARRA